MIQRRQTLYLLASGLLMLAMLFVGLAKVTTPDVVYTFKASGFEDLSGEIIQPSWILFGLNILIVMMSFITIFLYHKRVCQMRITIFNLILKVGIYVLFWVYQESFTNHIASSGVEWSLRITPWMALPIIAMIFDYLAHRGIAIDEKKIRFMDRLR